MENMSAPAESGNMQPIEKDKGADEFTQPLTQPVEDDTILPPADETVPTDAVKAPETKENSLIKLMDSVNAYKNQARTYFVAMAFNATAIGLGTADASLALIQGDYPRFALQSFLLTINTAMFRSNIKSRDRINAQINEILEPKNGQ